MNKLFVKMKSRDTCLAVIVGVALMSCEKNDALTPTGSTITQQAAIEKAMKLRWLIDLGTPDDPYPIGCRGSGGNCLPDFEVVGIVAPSIDNVWNAVLSEDRQLVMDAFLAERATLGLFMETADIEGVINGSLEAIGRYADPGEPVPERYLLIRNGNETVRVYPLKDE